MHTRTINMLRYALDYGSGADLLCSKHNHKCVVKIITCADDFISAYNEEDRAVSGS